MTNVFYGTKCIKALTMTRQEYNDYRGWELPADEDGSDAGFLVEYVDGGASNHPDHEGYISWSPADVFERAYQASGSMNFGHALQALKDGHRICRSGWNGKGMWLALSCEGSKIVPAEGFWSPHNADHARKQGGHATVLPSITMKTATGEILMGWLASQSDMLADDWMIVSD